MIDPGGHFADLARDDGLHRDTLPELVLPRVLLEVPQRVESEGF